MKINSIHSIVDVIASQYTIPLPLNKIAEEEGLRVIYDDYGRNTFDGMTWYEPDQDQFFIHINIARGNRENSSKARFTLAHELGHYFIDHHRHALETGKMQPHFHCYEPILHYAAHHLLEIFAAHQNRLFHFLQKQCLIKFCAKIKRPECSGGLIKIEVLY